jgi:hypothetical protein
LSSTTSGATIYYTMDGSTPTTSSTVYSSAISIAATTTLKALATHSGDTDSGIFSAVYTITIPTVSTPTVSVAAGTYTSVQNIVLSSTTPGATIYYTLDGTAPTTSSTVYTTAISVSASMTIEAFATLSGSINSGYLSAGYVINLPPPDTSEPAVVGTTLTSAYNDSPQSLTSSFTAGNTVLLSVVWRAVSAVPVVTCGTKTAVQVTTAVATPQEGDDIAFYLINNADGGSQTCTGVTNGFPMLIAATEVTGTALVDVSSTGIGSNGVDQHWSCGTFTTTGANRLGIAFGFQPFADTHASTGYTQLFSNSGASAGVIALPIAGAQSLTVDSQYNDNAACVSLALKR